MNVRCAMLAATAMIASCANGPLQQPLGVRRCIWVDRWDYRSARDIEVAFDACRQAGFRAVLFQVRGNGTVCYPSAIEVWSEHFGFRDPGFDPLAVAVRAAHARGLELHAWVNVAPGWVGTREPADEFQLWRSRRAWFLADRDGQPPPRADGRYLALNLCLPEVRAYLVDLCREITSRYEVDGLHLDYIRFPDPVQGGPDLGIDGETLARFGAATGRRASDLAALHAWQADCVTRLVAEVQAVVRSGRRHVGLSAAVFADARSALTKVRQDWPEWCRRRLVDWIVPMNYTDDDAQFAARVRAAVRSADGVPVIAGVGVYQLRDAAQSRNQLDLALDAGARGIGVFNYRSLFGQSNEVPPQRQRELRRGVGEWLEASARR